MKRAIVLLVIGISLLFAPSVFASAYVYTDTGTKTGFDISYQLILTPTGTNTYHAVFTLFDTSTTTEDWYAGAFQFKFTESNNADLTAFNPPTATWNIADYNTTVGVQTRQGAGGTYNA